MIDNIYISIKTGTMCQYPNNTLLPAIFEEHSDVFVRRDLEKYTVSKLVLMLPYCTICSSYVLNEEHNCELSLQDNCKYCTKFKDHTHYGFSSNMLCKSVKFEEIVTSPFAVRLNRSMFYLVTMCGEISTIDAQVMAPLLRSYVTPEMETVFTYNLSMGTYLVYSSELGLIRNTDIRYQTTETEFTFLGRGKAQLKDKFVDFGDAYTEGLHYISMHRDMFQFKFLDKFISIKKIYSYNFCDNLRYTTDITTGDLITRTILPRSPSLVISRLSLGEEQNDESDTVAHNDDAAESTPIISVPSDRVNTQSMAQVYVGGDSAESSQAIDQDFSFGPDSARTMVVAMSPEGPVDAISLATNDLPEEIVDYNLKHNLPEFANAWQSVQAVGDVFSPVFNQRTTYIMDMFRTYHSSVIWRIVVKPPLFQSQQFWVSFNPTIKGVPLSYDNANNLVGFNWNPSEQNEIYVVTPWSSLDYMTLTNDFTQLGELIITPRTSLITEAGLPAPLAISVYCAPLNIDLFTPTPLSAGVAPTDQFYFATVPVEGYMTFNVNSVANCTCALTQGDYDVVDSEKNSFSIKYDNDVVFEHTANVGLVSHTIGKIGINNVIVDMPNGFPLVLVFISESSFVVNSIVSQGTHDKFFNTNIPLNSTVSSFDSLGVSIHMPTAILTGSIEYSQDSSSGELLSFDTGPAPPNATYTFSLVQQIWEDPVEFTSSLTGPSVSGVSNSLLTVEPIVPAEGEEQMFKYVYNPNFKKNLEVYGTSFDHTVRLDNQFSLVSTQPLAAIIDSVTFDFLNPIEEFSNFDRDRHLLFSKYPGLKLESATNPATNVLLRVTQKHTLAELSLDECFQLPGFNWDPKTGPLCFQPYWSSSYPADYSDILTFVNPAYIQVNVLGGTIGTTMELVMWYNPQRMEYHNMIGSGSVGSLNESKNLKTFPQFKVEFRKKDKAQRAVESSIKVSKIKFKRRHKLDFTAEEQMESISGSTKTSILPSEGTTVETEKRWNYVASGQVGPDVSVISIPVNSRLFGPWAYKNAARFGRWHGNLRVKVMVNNSLLANGNFHVIHSNTHIVQDDIIDTSKFISILGDIDHSVMGAPGSAIELDLHWRTISPKLGIDHILNSADNGYLLICIPTFSLLPTATNIGSQITIYSDCSNLQYTLPCSTTYTGGYLPIGFTTANRT